MPQGSGECPICGWNLSWAKYRGSRSDAAFARVAPIVLLLGNLGSLAAFHYSYSNFSLILLLSSFAAFILLDFFTGLGLSRFYGWVLTSAWMVSGLVVMAAGHGVLGAALLFFLGFYTVQALTARNGNERGGRRLSATSSRRD